MKTKNTAAKLITMALALFVIASTTAHAQTSPPARRPVVVNKYKYVVRNVYRSGGANAQRSLPSQGYYVYRSGYGTPSFGGERTPASYPQYHRSGYDNGYQSHRHPQVQTRTPEGYQPSSEYESNMPPQPQSRSYPTYQRQSSPTSYAGQTDGGYGGNNGDYSQERAQGTEDEDSQDTAPAAPVASSSHHKKHQSLFKRLEHGVEREIHPVLRDLRHDAERQIHPVLRQARTQAVTALKDYAAEQLGW